MLGFLKKPSALRGALLVALGGIFWGFSGTCAQLMTSSMGVEVRWLTCVRLLYTAALFAIINLAFNRKQTIEIVRSPKRFGMLVIFAVFGVLMCQLCYFSAIYHSNASTATVFERLGLVLIMVITCVMARKLPAPAQLLGVFLALAGTFCIATKGNPSVLAIKPEAVFWGLGAALSLVGYTMLPEGLLRKWSSPVVTGWAMLLAGIVGCVILRPWECPPPVLSWQLFFVVTLTVVVGTLAAYLLFLQGVKEAGAMLAGMMGCVEPVAATLIAAVWLGTPVTPYDALGVGLIVAMVILVTPRDSSKKEAQGDTAADEAK